MSDLCSVVIPTHNRRDRLLKTLATITSQTYEPLEIIVSDDGSSDGTSDAVAALADDRVRVIRAEKGTGVARARNRGIEAATGRWVAFCDDDDFWTPGKLAGQVETMTTGGYRWGYCGVVEIDERFRPLRSALGPPSNPFARRLVFGNKVPGGCSSVIVERSMLNDVGRFDPVFSMFADIDLWIRLAGVGEPCSWLDYGVLYVHHQEQMSVMDMPAIARELEAFRHKHREARDDHPTPPFESLDRWIIQRLWSSGQRRDALAHARVARGSQGFARGTMTMAGVEWRQWQRRVRGHNAGVSGDALTAIDGVRRRVNCSIGGSSNGGVDGCADDAGSDAAVEGAV